MTAKLYVVPASHPCAAVERALQMKGIDYDVVNLVPVFHKLHQKVRFREGTTVPGIVFDDGSKVIGSRRIIRELEQRVPSPPLLPADAERRKLVEEAEEWGDQVLQALGRRVIWHALSRDRRAQQSYLDGGKLFPPTPAPLARAGAGAVAWAEKRIHGSNPATVKADVINLPRHLDRIDGWIAEGVIGGDEPNAADLQIGAAVRLLMTLDDLEPTFAGRPCADLARRLFPGYPGRVERGALAGVM